MSTSSIKERIADLAMMSGEGVLCIATPRMTYLVEFHLYDDEVVAQYVSHESTSEFYEFKDLSEFMSNVRESVEEYDKSVTGSGKVTFPADSMLVHSKKDPRDWFVVARNGRVVEEIGWFKAESEEEARKFYAEHREVDDR